VGICPQCKTQRPMSNERRGQHVEAQH
jgi:hypothetical protein